MRARTRRALRVALLVAAIGCVGAARSAPGHDHDGAMQGMTHNTTPPMDHAQSPSGPTASGTAWQPQAAPVFGLHGSAGPWCTVFHANAFALYDQQTDPRGATRFVGPAWAMWIAERPVGAGSLSLVVMLSPDPATVRPRGYPELFQTGETFRGKPLVDTHHPHDLVMALSSQWTQPISRRGQAFLHVAPVGEPALGPVPFPHRLSAMENPTVPLGHYWQDSTHITFGVLTGGLQTGRLRIEGSWFNGREPDGNRWDFDAVRLDSRSARAQYLAGPYWHLQVATGFLRQPEALESNDLTRTTASAAFARRRDGGYTVPSLVWGHNSQHQGGRSSDVVTLEGAYH